MYEIGMEGPQEVAFELSHTRWSSQPCKDLLDSFLQGRSTGAKKDPGLRRASLVLGTEWWDDKRQRGKCRQRSRGVGEDQVTQGLVGHYEGRHWRTLSRGVLYPSVSLGGLLRLYVMSPTRNSWKAMSCLCAAWPECKLGSQGPVFQMKQNSRLFTEQD